MDLRNLNKDKKSRRPPPVDLPTMVYGKVPPQAKELEEAILGACMIERGALAEVQDILTDTRFYLEKHQVIFRAMLNLDAKNQPIDILTVSEELTRMGKLEEIGGAYEVVKLTNAVVSAANIVTHARIVQQKWISRRIIDLGGQLVQLGYDETLDPFDLVDMAEKGISAITEANDRGNVYPISQPVVQVMTRIAELRKQQSHLTGIPSGWNALDRITHGWQDTDLIIVAARPSVGKTAFALNLARHAAVHADKLISVAFFSLEMSAGQLVSRMLSAETGVYLESVSTGQLSEEQMNCLHTRGAAVLADSKIFVDDTPALNIFELRAKCRRLKRRNKIGLIIIDYLQLMSGAGDNKNGNREQEISRISRDLKGLAKELQVPIIALSQLSRALENRQEKVPQLSDLRESGAIEQDADLVIFLYRPEYHGITADENGNSTQGETHVKIAKHRNGSLDTVRLRAQLHVQRFVEMDENAVPVVTKTTWKPISRSPLPNEKDDSLF